MRTRATRILLPLLVALALVWPVDAQVVGAPQSITVVDSGTRCVTAPTACATFALDTQTGGLTLSVSGTWTGTITFEGTNNDGVWTSLLATNLATGAQATTTTANGLFSITNAGVIKVTARATAAVTGSALVTAAKGLGFARIFGSVPIGTGGASATLGGTLFSSTTSANNVSTGETDLITYPMPGGTLAVNTRGVRITAWGTSAANVNAKTLKVYFGATVVATTVTSLSATPWVLRATVLRVTATTQTAAGEAFLTANNGGPTITAPGATLSGAVTLKVTGQSAVASDDITGLALLVEAI